MTKTSFVISALLLLTVSSFAAPVTIVFTAFQAPLQWQLGYPYTANVNGIPGVAVMCDDWAHGGLPGQTWQANFTDLGAINSGNVSSSSLRFNQSSISLMNYQEAGWLLLETLVTPRGQAWTDINTAVWHIFDQNTIMTPGAWYWVGQAQNEAGLGFPGVNFSHVGIYTPVNQYDSNPEGPQELLTIVPEPTTLLLAGSAAVGILAKRRRF